MDRGAPQDAPLGVDEVAVGRIRVEELGHFLHEPFEHRLDLELAGHDLRGVQERRLLVEPSLVLRQQARGVQRGVDLALDRVDEESLTGRELTLTDHAAPHPRS